MRYLDLRYLDLVQADGSWIDAPELYILARMAYEDKVDAAAVWQLYETMKGSDRTGREFTLLEQDIVKRHINRNLSVRVRAGVVSMQLVRMKQAGLNPSVNGAIRLAAHGYHQEFKESSQESLEVEHRKAFSKYRNTAHLQAAFQYCCEMHSGFDIESRGDGLLFLEVARALEFFLDQHVMIGNQKWDPWRIPETAGPGFTLPKYRELSNQEHAVASIAS